MATTDPILTLDECAQLLRMTPEYLRKSSCPRIRVGQRNVMYDREVAIRWMVADKVAIWDVAERLGHSDQSEAIRTYTKTVLRDAAKRLGVDSPKAKEA